MRSYAKSGVVDAIREAGGEVFGLTSEPQSLATEAEETWEIGFPSVGDPHHEIRRACRAHGFLDLFANEDYGHLRSRSWAAHPKGYFQPGVLALTNEGRVLYRWRLRPTRKNMSGAGQRPTPGYVWAQMQPRLADATDDAELDESPQFAKKDRWWPYNVAIMLAHGWFLRPKAFPLARTGDKPSAKPQRMKWRIAIFVGAWTAAFALLPTGWVALGLASWGALAFPGVVEIHRQFQNVPENREPDAV